MPHLCTKEERELLDALKRASVVTASPYTNNKGQLQFYRMRLFNPSERRQIRMSLPNDAAGMLDELEMVNYEAYGRPVEQITRQI